MDKFDKERIETTDKLIVELEDDLQYRVMDDDFASDCVTEEFERRQRDLLFIKMGRTLENIAKSLEIIAKKIQEQ